MDEQQHNALELPKGLYEPVLRQPMELDFCWGRNSPFAFMIWTAPMCSRPAMAISAKQSMPYGDYARLLEMACEQWDLTGFHRALYEYHAEKMREIAGKFQAGIGYDYDAAMENAAGKRNARRRKMILVRMLLFWPSSGQSNPPSR